MRKVRPGLGAEALGRGSENSKGYRDMARPGVVLVAPAVLVLLATAIFPLLYALAMSFSQGAFLSGEWEFAGLDNYIRAFGDARFWVALWTTLQFAIPSLLIELTLGMLVALLLNRKLALIQVARPLTLLPMMVTPVVVGLIWAIMYNPSFGIVNYLLGLVGVDPVMWLASPVYSKLAIIITNVWEWTAFAVLVFLAGLQGLPAEPFRAARVDGATSWQVFWRLTLPLMMPKVLVVVLIRTIWLLQLFDIVWVITAGGPGSSTEPVSLYIYKQAFHFFDLGYAAALSFVLLIVVTVICTVIIRLWRGNR
jgi:multiple sugar transport system permease protein